MVGPGDVRAPPAPGAQDRSADLFGLRHGLAGSRSSDSWPGFASSGALAVILVPSIATVPKRGLSPALARTCNDAVRASARFGCRLPRHTADRAGRPRRLGLAADEATAQMQRQMQARDHAVQQFELSTIKLGQPLQRGPTPTYTSELDIPVFVALGGHRTR